MARLSGLCFPQRFARILRGYEISPSGVNSLDTSDNSKLKSLINFEYFHPESIRHTIVCIHINHSPVCDFRPIRESKQRSFT
jgi:hypothetical protein